MTQGSSEANLSGKQGGGEEQEEQDGHPQQQQEEDCLGMGRKRGGWRMTGDAEEASSVVY